MKEHIHRHGRRYSAAELIKKVSGHTLSEKPYVQYLTKKYSAIYDLQGKFV
jgi:carboxypeptidase Taq